MDENILKLKKLVSESSNIVFFGGAGVSTESGIPDFRSEQGIYNTVKNFGYPPEQILSHSFFMKNPEKFYDFYRSTMIYENAKPNLAHLGLAKLEKQGKLKAIVTQNIDGLHQLAGSKTVYELHCSFFCFYCMKCGKFYPLSTITESKGVPQCKECGGTIKPDVVLYEEGLDEEIINNSIKAIKKADMLIVGGTSLNVYPAASFVNYYDGNKLILINKSKTPYDRYADLLIHDSIGKVFNEIIE